MSDGNLSTFDSAWLRERLYEMARDEHDARMVAIGKTSRLDAFVKAALAGGLAPASAVDAARVAIELIDTGERS